MAWVAAEFSEAAKLRIKEAAQFEKRIRLEAFIGLPTEIASFRLRPLTGNHILQLQYAENALYCGGYVRDLSKNRFRIGHGGR